MDSQRLPETREWTRPARRVYEQLSHLLRLRGYRWTPGLVRRGHERSSSASASRARLPSMMPFLSRLLGTTAQASVSRCPKQSTWIFQQYRWEHDLFSLKSECFSSVMPSILTEVGGHRAHIEHTTPRKLHLAEDWAQHVPWPGPASEWHSTSSLPRYARSFATLVRVAAESQAPSTSRQPAQSAPSLCRAATLQNLLHDSLPHLSLPTEMDQLSLIGHTMEVCGYGQGCQWKLMIYNACKSDAVRPPLWPFPP